MSIEAPQGKDLNLRFEVLENSGAFLRCRYQAQNVSKSDLYIFNRLWHEYNENSMFELDPNMVYISSVDSTVHILKGIPDIPDNIFVEMPVIPLVTLLPSSQNMSEIFQVELPLKRIDAYFPEEQTVIENPSSIVFSLGYFPVNQIGDREVHYVNTTLGQALSAHVTPWDQYIVSSTAVPITVGSTRPQAQKTCPNCGAVQLPDSKFCSQCGSPL